MRFNWNPDFGLPSSNGIADLLRKISGEDSGLTMLGDAIDPRSAMGSGMGAAATQPPMIGDSATRGMPTPYGAMEGAGGPQTPQTLLEMLMAQAMGGSSRSSVRAATAPQRALVDALQGQLGQVGAQTAQNQADIDSWMGQLGGMFTKNAKGARRAGKKSQRQTVRLGSGLMAGVADKNVARGIGQTATRQGGYLRRDANEQANFAANQASDASREGEYMKLVQQRLGMQQEADIRSQLAQAQAAKVAAKSEAKSGDMGQLLQVLGLVGDSPELDKILGVPSAEGGGFDLEQGSALQSALGSVDVFNDKDAGGGTVGNADLESIIKKMYGAAKSRGLNIESPEVKDAIRSYVASHFLDQYNSLPGKDYELLNGGFRLTN